jgi:Interleukin-like EMT inducer/Glycosyl hydrolases family 2, TIM barrel domain
MKYALPVIQLTILEFRNWTSSIAVLARMPFHGYRTGWPRQHGSPPGLPYLTFLLGLALLCCPGVTLPALAASPGPSLVSVSGRQLLVRKRNVDGTLGAESPYVVRGVNWSPASKDTMTSKGDPANATVRRPEFAKWYSTDIPLLKAMNVNTVRTSIDMGFDGTALTILDTLYANGIMVIMTVDDAINDTARSQQAVAFYKDHPAILMWMLGNEWNINQYYGTASSVPNAAQRTQNAAALIKAQDTNHPVGTSYGEIDINSDGSRLADTRNYVQNICTSVDVWGLNIYRGSSFGQLFDQWISISGKPMFVGEFGTDAFRSTSLSNPPSGFVETTMQAHWILCLWNEIFGNLSAKNPFKAALGGLAFEWNDEWWKVQPASSQETNGFVLVGGHPDDFANEEYFGIVDIDRIPRQEVYDTLGVAFDPSYQASCPSITVGALSRGGSAEEYPFELGVARFYRCGRFFYEKTGGGGGGRGFNVVALDPATSNVIQAAQNFDTYATRSTGAAMNAMISFLNGLPNGALIMLAVADEAGLTADSSCTHLSFAWTEAGFQALEDLGSLTIRNYCFRNSWSMIAVKGEGRARDERLSSGTGASVKFACGNQPCVVSVTPSSGSGTSQTFQFQVSDTAGASDLAALEGWFTPTSTSAANTCLIYYGVASHLIYLASDDVSSWTSQTIGAAGTLPNSQCAVNVGGTTATPNGNNLTLSVPITFKPGFAGSKQIFMFAVGSATNSGWQIMGNWTTSIPIVSAGSVTPNAGSGTSQTFQFLASDGGGNADLVAVEGWFTPTSSTAANTCLIYYATYTRLLYRER